MSLNVKIFDLICKELVNAARTGQLNDVRQFLKPPVLAHAQKHGFDIFGTAAGCGHLNQVLGLLTQKNVTWKVVHAAAANGHLDQIPEKFLSHRKLTQSGESGWTALHAAAYNGHLKQVAAKFLTSKTLKCKDAWGNTVADIINENPLSKAYFASIQVST